MTRVTRTILLLVTGVFCLCFAQGISANTQRAKSVSLNDINSAISAAKSGDVVIVPAGTATWNNQLVITKGIMLIGAGMDRTVITSNFRSENPGNIFDRNNYIILYQPESPELNEAFRLSGFTFDLNNKCYGVMLENKTLSAINKIRIDHCKIVNYSLLVHIYGTVYGVIDNNEFAYGHIRCNALDATTWNNLTFEFGTADNMYFENNNFTSPDTMFFYGEMGGRYCVRYNTFNGANSTNGLYPFADMHGNQPNAHHSTMGAEIYENTISCNLGINLLDQRGGKALVYNNNLITPSSAFTKVREEFNDAINPPAENPISGQPQHVSDSYYWGNKKNGTTMLVSNPYIAGTVNYGEPKGLVPQENREFWRQIANFNGTKGVGVGTLSARPANCNVGVGYWATDEKILYRCASPNTWEAYYTPYIYPHPLTRVRGGIIGLSRRWLNVVSTTEINPSSQSFLIQNDWYDSVLAWNVTENDSWLSCTPTSGEGDSLIEVSFDSSGLEPGVYEAVIYVTSEDALNSPASVNVTLTIEVAGTTAGPFGIFDTPVDGASVYGSVPVTGWALDDIEVSRVEIKRRSVDQDPPELIGEDGLVYIGDACFVEGSRPDVEQLFPSYPLNSRAGWGYLMLTYGLPNQGNGTYELHAFAYDLEGHRVWLGQKKIHSDNAGSDMPFGAIDTPGQGGTISTSEYVNFGWALTPQPKAIPLDGSTIWVWVDGVALGNPVYNNYRSDIATAFPGYANSGGAVGYYNLNLTNLANGMHSLGWTVTDDAGKTEGIGSRFFSVLNSANGMDVQLKDTYKQGGAQSINPNAVFFNPSESLTDILDFPLRFEPLAVCRGFDPRSEPELCAPDPFGTVHIGIDQVGRLEIGLSGRPGPLPASKSDLKARYGADSWRGYLIVGEELRPLPVGSSLSPNTGVFVWQLAPVFFGEYLFIFIRDRDGFPVRTQVSVLVGHGCRHGIKG